MLERLARDVAERLTKALCGASVRSAEARVTQLTGELQVLSGKLVERDEALRQVNLQVDDLVARLAACSAELDALRRETT